MGMGRVLDHDQLMTFGHVKNAVQVDRPPPEMDGNDRPRTIGDHRLYRRRIQGAGNRIDIGEDRYGIQIQRGRGGGNPTDRGHDHFVTRSYPGGAQCYLQGDSPVHGGNTVLCVVVRGKARRELVRLKAGLLHIVSAPAAALDHLDDGIYLALIVDRPFGNGVDRTGAPPVTASVDIRVFLSCGADRRTGSRARQ